MNHKLKKFLRTVYIIFGAFILFFILMSFWLYQGKPTALKSKFFAALPYPMALVNNRPVLMKTFVFRYQLSKKILGMEAFSQKEPEIKKTLYAQIINEEKNRQVANKYNIQVSQNELAIEFNRLSSQIDIQNKTRFLDTLAIYGFNESAYKETVIKPELFIINLRIWFNTQKDLNSSEFEQAETLIKRIQNSEDMAILAASFSQDDMGKSVGGDLGFVDTPELLWELREPVSGLQINETKVIPSRFGIHLVKLEGKDGNKFHLRQIFLKGKNFDAWLTKQTDNFKIKKLISI